MDSTSSSFRASKLEDWEVEAADRLKAIFAAKSTMSQKAFGARFEIGTGGMVSQYLNKKRPLGLKTAIKFAKGLGVPVVEISQHLAAQLPKEHAGHHREVAELQEVVTRLTTSGKMQLTEVAAMVAMLKAREGN
jgi:transcriptional regulator with XRE-family HTH domain